ncbi:large-conductance mechanosensitive channel protein MscL [Cytobacillus depressus]|uniref:Large-conductance mechanosensitive channel n=1 Tax=Cytobacillus depressus TaxID=1602942 RepID=A0A6L3V6T1_9BACI|nr:large-conductance mechanosensitive channel protein MscL [Cytobacillus depressus]KAB2336056.1 large-conductance mechanosensitive channel protein MscL [Cytobacillus depressus]
MLNEFKKFALKGNVLDLAVGVIIGAAFGKIVSSLVEDIIMPLVGLLVGGVDLTKQLVITVGTAEVKIGAFAQTILDFVIIAFSIYIFVKIINKRFKKQEEPQRAAAEVDKKEVLLTEIRDLLKEK